MQSINTENGSVLRLLHGADLHLDSPFAGLSPELAALRRSEQRQLLSDLASLARQRQVDGVLLSGDVLDAARCFRETGEELARQLGAMGCPVFIAPGNHDPYTAQSPYETLSWPDNVHIFSRRQVEQVALPEKNCTIHGAAFCAEHEVRSPLAGFSVPEDGGLHVMVLHGDVDGAGEYAPLTRQDIAASGLDYLALGHVHRFSGVQKEGNTFWAYPGCAQGRGFDETGEKGVLYLELEKEACRAEFIPLARRRYESLTVDVTGWDDPADALRRALPREKTGDIYRVVLTGERTREMDVAALERELAPGFFSLTVTDRTRAPRQLWERMGEETLTGLFLREMARRCAREPENELYLQAVRFGLAALEGEEDVAP